MFYDEIFDVCLLEDPFDEEGKPRLADRSINPYSVFELSEPSEPFITEFNRRKNYIETYIGLEFTNRDGKPIRIMAVPGDRKRSPIAYVAQFSGNREWEDPDLSELIELPWFWEFYLFAVGEHFVKIHAEGPYDSYFKIAGAGRNVINAIEWLAGKSEEPDELAPEENGD